jgi:preprotein translocase subunit YajC
VAEFLFQPTTAPAREAPGGATSQPVAPPQGAEAPRPGFDPTMIVLLLLPLVLFFFLSRSQSKKQKELEASLKVGDKVVLRSGLVGKLIELGDRAKVEIAPGVKVEVLKSGIEGRDGGDVKSGGDAKAKEPAKDKPGDKADKKAS